jgi:DedD protein
MSIFNFRRGRPANASGKASAALAQAAESVEVVRRRARQRLIGSAVLVLLGVLGFPLLFETQPRAVPVDLAIEIPSRNAVKPGAPIAPIAPAQPVAPKEQIASPVTEPAKADAPPVLAANTAPVTVPAVSAQASLVDKEEIVDAKPTPPVKVDPKPATKPETQAELKPKAEIKPKVEAKVEAKPKIEPKPEAKPVAKPKLDDGQRARALLDGNTSSPPSADKRMVVQVGAFADEALAREARAKLERAGLKTYTHVAETKDGKRIRVRVGPFTSRAEADKAASKIKTLNLPAAVLEL